MKLALGVTTFNSTYGSSLSACVHSSLPALLIEYFPSSTSPLELVKYNNIVAHLSIIETNNLSIIASVSYL
jgi:hypothetical protein